jgi:hypothetical protein
VVYSTTRSLQEAGNNLADIYVAGSLNGGNSFIAPERVAASVVETADNLFPTMYFAPATVLEVSAGPQTIRRWAFATRLPSRLVAIYSDAGMAWKEVRIVPPSSCEESLEMLEEPVPPGQCPGRDFFAQRSRCRCPGATGRCGVAGGGV